MTDQSNGENISESTEGQQGAQIDVSAILEKLTMHGDVLAKLAAAPETVNADGLKHLSDQTKTMVETIQALPGQVQSTVKQTITANETAAMDRVQALELALTRREIMAEFGFGRDDEKLFAPYKTADEIRDVAKSLAERIKTAAPAKSSAVTFAKPDDVKIASHLSHLRSN